LGHHQVGFQVGRYDHSKPLVIDPTLSYSTYLGGGGDAGVAVAVDGSGKAYVTGVTSSTNFPTKNPLQPKNAGGEDVFVAEFDTTLAGAASLVYSTYLGGSGDDYGTGIAVDSNGNAYLTGSTHSTNFPTFHAAQASGGGGWDSFVTELNNTGTALVYSTYLGGSGSEQGRTGYHSPYGIALSTDASGNTFAYVAGETTSTDFPTTPGAYQRVFGGGRSDAYVVKLNPALKGPQSLVYSSYFGGNSEDGAYGIAADTAGNAYLTGDTLSTNLPTTPGAYQTTAPGGFNAFVTEFNPTGSGLVYSTYLGGSNVDEGRGIAIDGAGNAYVTGYTSSTDFPTQNAAQSTNAGQTDAFVTQLNATGTGLLYSTYHGGSSLENGIGIAVDNAGNAYVTGYTRSSDFPIKNAFKTTNVSGNQTDFVTKLNPSLSGPDSLVYSSYLGGSGGENDETAVAVDKVTGEAYVTGATSSTDFPTKNPFQAHLSKGKNAQNAFLSKISAS